MNKFEISFLALSHSIDMVFESETSFDEFTNDFLMLFTKKEDIDYENHKINIQSLQQCTKELIERVDKLIEKYKSVNIKIFQLRTYFQKLSENECFLLLPGISLTTEQSFYFYNYLSSLQEGEDFKTTTEQFDSLFGDLLKTYTFKAFDINTKKTIGEPDKTKRVCRFCNNTRENITFKNVAHAISESLGNKTIILNEECDECNSTFGSATGIESSLITYLKLYNSFFGIKGKEKIPKFKGKNFKLSNEGKIELHYYAKTDEEANKEIDITELNYQLETYDNIVMQNIYKTLCKYALSVIDSEFLPEFTETIKWINGKQLIEKLPKVAILNSYSFFKTHPSLIVYLRKTDNKDLPFAVGELHYTFLTFVFIIPLANSDNKDFTNENEYKTFWESFKHYSSIADWSYKNFSDNTVRKFMINLNIVKNDDKNSIPE